MNRIEDLLQSLHTYFARSSKWHLEFVKLAEVLETKSLKILRQVKTRWLSMMSPAIQVMNEYRTLVYGIWPCIEYMALYTIYGLVFSIVYFIWHYIYSIWYYIYYIWPCIQ
jgi:hypothetical protein